VVGVPGEVVVGPVCLFHDAHGFVGCGRVRAGLLNIGIDVVRGMILWLREVRVCECAAAGAASSLTMG
jgi:hypothetical protein